MFIWCEVWQLEVINTVLVGITFLVVFVLELFEQLEEVDFVYGLVGEVQGDYCLVDVDVRLDAVFEEILFAHLLVEVVFFLFLAENAFE
jgi:hypothetical protein